MSKPTYCLHKLQEVLADFLEIDVKTLPNIADNLKKAGYIGVDKNGEISYFYTPKSKAFHNTNIAPRGGDASSTYSSGKLDENLDSAQPKADTHDSTINTPKEQGNPLPEFGENYPQYYHNGAGAIEKLLETKGGQVAGAFYREGLGDIDLVWGEVTDPKNHKGFGLAHILDKRTAEFMQEGLSKEEAESKAREFVQEVMPKIINEGKIVENAGVKTIILKQKDSELRVGLSKGFQGVGDNEWIITSYERKNPHAQNFDQATHSKELENGNNLSLKDLSDSTTRLDLMQENKNRRNEKRLETIQTRVADDFTDETLANKPLSPNQQADSTTTLSPFARALQEKNNKIAKEEAQLKAEQAKETQKRAEYNQKIEELDRQKQSLAGLAANKRTLERGQEIDQESIGVDANLVIDEDNIIALEYVRVKAQDLAPNFENTQLQPRTEQNQKLIKEIAENFKPELMIGVGGFRDLPIITQWGAVVVGNHRLEGMLHFTPQSRTTYEQTIKETYGIELAPDEMLVRIPKEDLSDEQLVNLAYASNAETTHNIGDRVFAALGKYDKNLENLPQHIQSDSLDTLTLQVARIAQPHIKSPDEFGANLALLAKLAKNSNGKNIAQALNHIQNTLDPTQYKALQNMFVNTAGAWHNLVNDLGEGGVKNLELRPYLLDTITATASMLGKSRAENFSKLARDIEYLLHTTDENGTNAMVAMNKESYKNIISDLLGASLARFVRLENPSNSLYEVLKNAKSDLEEMVTPSLLSAGKPLSEVDVYDFIELLISKGEASEATSKVVDLLPALREKERAFNAKISSGDSPKPQIKENENGNNTRNNLDFSRISVSSDSLENKRILDNARVASVERNTSRTQSGERAEHRAQTQDRDIANANQNTQRETRKDIKEITFKDSKGKEHTLTKETQEQWLKTFELESLEQSYMPKHSEEIKEVLGGKEIKLQKGSLLKLVSQGREQYIPQIKAVLDDPEAILYDVDNGFLLTKHLKGDDYFVNVSYDKGEYLVSISNGIKEVKNLQNNLNAGAKILYQSPSFRSSRNKLLQTSQFSANKIDKLDSTTSFARINLDKRVKEIDNGINISSHSNHTIQNPTNIEENTRERFIRAKEQIPQDLQEAWVQEFGLKSIDDTFVPSFKPEVKEALQKAGVSDDFHLKIGSLIKLNNRQRQEFLPYIKPTIQEPNLVLDNGRGILFIKEFIGEDKNRYFMSVAKDHNGKWIFSTHTRKELKDIQKEVKKSKIFYNKGFKGEEVAGASDILESGGTTTKPSDLQIEYPANHSSGINPKADSTTKQNQSEVFSKNKEFDEYLAENSKYHIDWVDVLDSSPVNVSIMREFILDSKKSLENGINKELPQSLREKIQTALDIRPIAEFGKNYAEYFRDGQRGIAKLLAEAKDYEARKEAGNLTEAEIEQGAYKGQVAGAFYKEGLGDIDLVWGEITDAENHKGYGLAHILDKRTAEFMQEGLSEREAKAKAEAFAKNEIPNIFENGEVIKKPNEAVRIETDKYKLILKQNWEGEPTQNKWLVTAYFKKEKEPSISTDSFTKGETLPLNSKDDSTTTLHNIQATLESYKDLPEIKRIDTLLAKDKDIQDSLQALQEQASKLKSPKGKDKARANELEKQYQSLLEDLESNAKSLQKAREKFKAKEPQAYQSYKAKSNPLQSQIPYCLSDDVFNQVQYLRNREATRKEKNDSAYNARLKELIESKKAQYQNLLDNLTNTKNPIAQLKKLYYQLTKIQPKGFHNKLSAQERLAVNELSDSIDKTLHELLDKLPESNKQKLLQEVSTKAGEFKHFMETTREEVDYILNVDSSKLGEYFTQAKAQAGDDSYKLRFLERLEKQTEGQVNGFANTGDVLQNLTTQGEKSIKELRSELKTALAPIINKDITNKETGKVARITDKERNKISSEKALKKSLENGFTKEQHYKTGEHIKELFESANLRETHADSKGRPNIKEVYRFEKDLIIDNKEAVAKITMFEKIEGNNKIYSLELEGLSKPDSLSPSAQGQNRQTKLNTPDNRAQEITTIAKSDEADSTTDSLNLQSNAHIGSGMLGGSAAGVETDENGNIIGFDPEKFALGFLGGAGGSVALSKGFRFLKDNPQYKEALKQELANTIERGWEATTKQYPILETIARPNYIVQNEKGRLAQAGNVLNKLQETFLQNNLINEKALNAHATKLPKPLSKEEFLAQITDKDTKGYSTIQTPIGQIQVNLAHAWKHINKGNTYKKDRSKYSGAFLDTLTDPLFIVKQEYIANPKLSANAREMQNSKLVQANNDEIIAQDSYVFFKPYHTQSGFNYMIGYALDIEGNIINTTFIPMGKKDFGRIKKILKSEVLYYKDTNAN